jgi:hypothetical protein
MKRTREMAGGFIPFNDGLAPGGDKQMKPDSVMLSPGNVAVRLGMMMRMRKNASLSGRHRDVQRWDKEIMLLRASLGLTPDPPPEVTRTHRNGKDPTNGENLMISSTASKENIDWSPKPDQKRGRETIKSDGFSAAQNGHGSTSNPYPQDVAAHKWWGDGHKHYHQVAPRESANSLTWMKQVSTSNLATLMKFLHERGYEYSSRKEGPLTVHTFKGYYGPQPDKLEVSMFGREWAVAAIRNGNRMPVFELSSGSDVEKGIPLQATASTWDGTITPQLKQAYASSWAKLLRDLR